MHTCIRLKACPNTCKAQTYHIKTNSRLCERHLHTMWCTKEAQWSQTTSSPRWTRVIQETVDENHMWYANYSPNFPTCTIDGPTCPLKTQRFKAVAWSMTKCAPFPHLCRNSILLFSSRKSTDCECWRQQRMLREICICHCKATGEPYKWQCLLQRISVTGQQRGNAEAGSRKSTTIEH